MKQRRVGTITLGISLVLLGIIIPLVIIYRTFYLLSFLPIVLIFLGIEIIVYSCKFKDEKTKYDGLSVFFCILITFTTISAGGINSAIQRGIDLRDRYYNAEELVFTTAESNELSCISVSVHSENPIEELVRDSSNRLTVSVTIDNEGYIDSEIDKLSNNIASFLRTLFEQDGGIYSVFVEMNINEENGFYDILCSFNRINAKDVTAADVKKRIEREIESRHAYYFDYSSENKGYNYGFGENYIDEPTDGFDYETAA